MRFHLDDFVQSPTLRPGVKQYLHEARDRGIKTAIASNADLGWIKMLTDKFNLLSYFDIVVTANDVKNPKPDPEIYNLVLKKLNVQENKASSNADCEVKNI